MPMQLHESISRFTEGRRMPLRCDSLEPPMSQMGHSQPVGAAAPAAAACPLCLQLPPNFLAPVIHATHHGKACGWD